MDFQISWVLNTTPLYRIMPLKRLMLMLANKCNTLISPSKWDDPYETIYSNSVIETENGDVPLDASHWFGQCWSLCEESAIMWQAFKKQDEPYVKIKVYANSLTKGLKEQNNTLRIGVLDYIRYFTSTVGDFCNIINHVIPMHQWLDNFVSRGARLEELYPLYSLLTKRDIFKHEEEVRLLLFDKSSSEEQESISYSFDPTTIEEVVVDPWTSKDNNKFQKIVEELRQHLSSDTTNIRTSNVFDDCSKFAIRFNRKALTQKVPQKRSY